MRKAVLSIALIIVFCFDARANNSSEQGILLCRIGEILKRSDDPQEIKLRFSKGTRLLSAPAICTNTSNGQEFLILNVLRSALDDNQSEFILVKDSDKVNASVKILSEYLDTIQ